MSENNIETPLYHCLSVSVIENVEMVLILAITAFNQVIQHFIQPVEDYCYSSRFIITPHLVWENSYVLERNVISYQTLCTVNWGSP